MHLCPVTNLVLCLLDTNPIQLFVSLEDARIHASRHLTKYMFVNHLDYFLFYPHNTQRFRHVNTFLGLISSTYFQEVITGINDFHADVSIGVCIAVFDCGAFDNDCMADINKFIGACVVFCDHDANVTASSD